MAYDPYDPEYNDAQAFDDRDVRDTKPEDTIDEEFSRKCADHL